MAGDRNDLPQNRDVMVQDFQLVQTFHEARALARRHGDDPAWKDLAASLDRILDRLGADDTSPNGVPAVGIHRIDRPSFRVDADTANQTTSALMALADRPDATRLDQAGRSVGAFEDALGRD